MLIPLLLLVTLAQARVTIIDSSCESRICQENLMTYVTRMNSQVSAQQIGKRIMSVITHEVPPQSTTGLYALAYITTTTKIIVNDLTKTITPPKHQFERCLKYSRDTGPGEV